MFICAAIVINFWWCITFGRVSQIFCLAINQIWLSTVHITCASLVWFYTANFSESHFATLQTVFNRFHAAGLRMSFEECQRLSITVEILLQSYGGWTGLRPVPDKVQVILQVSPSNVKEVRFFMVLPLCTAILYHYRSFD